MLIDGPALPDVPAATIRATGDTVDGVMFTHPELLRVFIQGIEPAMRSRGLRCSIVSAARPRAEQAIKYRNYLAGRGDRAAPPGRSAHEYGLAIDVVITAPPGLNDYAWAKTAPGRAAYAQLHRIAKHYGLDNIADVAPDDPYHLQAPGWKRLAGLSH